MTRHAKPTATMPSHEQRLAVSIVTTALAATLLTLAVLGAVSRPKDLPSWTVAVVAAGLSEVRARDVARVGLLAGLPAPGAGAAALLVTAR